MYATIKNKYGEAESYAKPIVSSQSLKIFSWDT